MSEIHEGAPASLGQRLQTLKQELPQYSLLTKEGAIAHFKYKAPDETTRPKYGAITRAFVALVTEIFDLMPDGPGRTLALRKLSEARMQVNSAIANEGQ